MMISFLTAALLAATTPQVQDAPPVAPGVVMTEGGPEEDVMVTEPALRSRIAVNEVRNPWRGAGTMAVRRGRRAAPPLRIDYDRDGVVDTVRLVQSRIHSAVLLTSGKTGRTRPIWLIDSDGLGADVHLGKGGKNTVEIVFPESTVIFLFDRNGAPMATYQNG